MTDQQRIHDLIERWVAAVHAGDMPTVLADHAPESSCSTFRRRSAASAAWTRTAIPGQASSTGRRPERCSRSTRWRSRPVWTSRLPSRCCAAVHPRTSIETPSTGLRLTIGLHKENDRWVVTHEYHSFADTTGSQEVAVGGVSAKHEESPERAPRSVPPTRTTLDVTGGLLWMSWTVIAQTVASASGASEQPGRPASPPLST